MSYRVTRLKVPYDPTMGNLSTRYLADKQEVHINANAIAYFMPSKLETSANGSERYGTTLFMINGEVLDIEDEPWQVETWAR